MRTMEEPRPAAAPDPVSDTARSLFGIEYLFPYQRLVIANILDAAEAMAADTAATDDGECDDSYDAYSRQIVILPTGAGKSLCFQLPAALLPGPTVVVYPLLSLMADQARRLKRTGPAAVLLKGGQSPEEQEECVRRIRTGSARILLSNPETLARPRATRLLTDSGFVHMVIDEAHCVTEWGRSFRPAYLELPRIIRESGVPIVTAFTATASPVVLDAIRETLFSGSPVHLVQGCPDRPNISYRVIPTLSKLHTLKTLLAPSLQAQAAGETAAGKDACLPHPAIGTNIRRRDRAGSTAGGTNIQPREPRGRSKPAAGACTPPLFPEYQPVRRPALVFCRSRKRAELAAERLREAWPQEEILFYHAGLSREEKRCVEDRFYSSKSGILCATCAYGMGVDKGDIRSVVHLDLPGSIEAYLQEAGRGGRDGEHAEAVVLTGPEDRHDIAAAEQTATDRYRAARELVMRNYLTSGRCRRQELLSLLGTEVDVCFGCDLCSGTAERVPRGLEPIARFVRRHRRRFDASAASRVLWFEDARLRQDGWDPEELEAAIAQACRTGAVHRIRWGPWKGLLTARAAASVVDHRGP